jgi:hypothetical protein
VLFRHLIAITTVAGIAVLAGCATEDKSEPVASSDSADLTLRAAKLLGNIEPGETKTAMYTPPQKRAWAFTAQAGDTVSALVHSATGDAMAFITDSNYNVLAYNDDANADTQDAKIVLTIPTTCTSTSFRIVFADYNSQPASFDVTYNLDVNGEGAKCTYGSQVYQAGQTFPAADGCNTCTCLSNADISCTKNICSCDPAHEPNKIYKGTPRECQSLGYNCGPNQVKFSNACGCGCLILP